MILENDLKIHVFLAAVESAVAAVSWSSLDYNKIDIAEF